MILGDICTRSCKFCNVKTGKPLPPDKNEPYHIAETVKLLSIKHLVLTSVDRDDLPDLGSEHWAQTILEVKKLNPGTTIEALIPDFQGNKKFINKIINASPEVISHNLETVKRLTPLVRTKAKYATSLDVLGYIAQSGITAKTGIMAGLGETQQEVLDTMQDAYKAGCSVFTVGQYLQPAKSHFPVKEYVPPEIFDFYKTKGIETGFKHVESHPLVRSSYHAEKHII